MVKFITLILAVFLYISVAAQAGQSIVCNGQADWSVIQGALDAGGRIEIADVCVVHETLFAEVEQTSLEGPGRIISSADPAIMVTGRNITFERFRLDAPGVGVEFRGSGRTFLRDLQINSGDDGLLLITGAGLWASGLHFNGVPGNADYAVRIIEWDTAFFTDILSEEHDGGFRIGNRFDVANLWLSNIVLDRLRIIGIFIEPVTPGHVANVQMVNIWAHGNSVAMAPVLLNAQEGAVYNIEIVNGLFHEFNRQEIWVFGPVQNVRAVNLIFD